jgi:nitric oxide reductase activation protein
LSSYREQIERKLAELGQLSFVAHRDALVALPKVERHGEAETLDWLAACHAIYAFDRDAGRAFVEGTFSAEEATEEVRPWTRDALRFTQWAGSWRALEGYMNQLPAARALLGERGAQRWSDIGIAWCGRHLESGKAYFATPVKDLAGRLGIAGIEQLDDCAAELHERRRLDPATYLEGALRVRNLFGAKAVLPWALRGADIMQAGRLRGEAYFRLESEESLTLLLEAMPGFRPMERSRLLGVLLAVWFEETFDLKEGTWTPEKGRPFIESDGRSLMLPAVMTDTDEAVLAALHSAGHMVYGSYDRPDVEAMFAHAGVPLPAQGEPLTLAPLYLRHGGSALRFKLLFDLCEDLRVDVRIQARVPNHLKRMLRAARAQGTPVDVVAPFYALATDSLAFALGEATAQPEAVTTEFAGMLLPGATIADAFRAADRLMAVCAALPDPDDPDLLQHAYLPGRSPNASRAFHAREKSAEPEQGEQGSEKSETSDQQQQQGDQNHEQEEGEGQSVEQSSGESEKREVSGAGNMSGVGSAKDRQGDRRQAQQNGGEKGIPYPEWDYREGRHKRNWAWVQEKTLAESNMSEAQRLEAQYANTLKRLKQALQSQKPTRFAPERHQLDGDDIDIEAAVEYVIERRAGRSPTPAIYRRRELKQRETSVILLADLSTSIMQLLPEGRGRLVDRIRAGILLFAESLEMVGDTYAIAGFCSKYRDNVSYYTIKDFDQPWSQDVKAVVGGLSGRLATRMGTAIRHATHEFDRVPSRRRLLLLLSDGRPEDYDDGGDRRYLHEDTRMAVKEAVNKGVHPFCITVDTLANEYLPQIFGKGHYLVLDHINSLPNKLPEIYLRLRR